MSDQGAWREDRPAVPYEALQRVPAELGLYIAQLRQLAAQRMSDVLSAGHRLLGAEVYSRAGEYFQQALWICRLLGEERTECWVLEKLSQVDLAAGRYAEAAEKAEQAVMLATSCQSPDLAVPARLRLGSALVLQDQIEAGLVQLRAACRAADAADALTQIEAWVSLGSGLLRAGALNEARESLARAQMIAAGPEAEGLHSICLANSALLTFHLGDLRGAVATAERAVAAGRAYAGEPLSPDDVPPRPRVLWQALVVLGTLYAELGEGEEQQNAQRSGRFERAEQALDEACHIVTKLGDSGGKLRALTNKAMFLSRCARYKEAIALLQGTVIPLARELADQRPLAYALITLADTEVEMAVLSPDRGDFYTTRRFPPLGPADPRTHPDIPTPAIQAAYRKGRRIYSQARRLLLPLRDAEGLRIVDSRLGDLLAHQPGQEREAARCYRRSINGWERGRRLLHGPADRMGFFGRGADPYAGLLSLAIRRGRGAEALAISEKARARTLLDSLDGRPAGARPVAWGEVHAALRMHAEAAGRRIVFVQYVVDRRNVYAILMSATMRRPEIRVIPIDPAALRNFVSTTFGDADAVRYMVEDMGLEHWHRYRDLVTPLAEHAGPGDLVYLAPHGTLHDLPLHTLPVEGVPLGLRNPVVYTPSASVFAYQAAHDPRSSKGRGQHVRAAVFGNSLGDLPYAEKEARAVAAHFGVPTCLGMAVTAEALSEAFHSCDIIHIAGHADFSQGAPGERSAVLLGGGKRLLATDIIRLRPLRPRLVILSCCQTSVTAGMPGEERVGLSRALIGAGVPTLLASQWSVLDDSAAFLMSQFHAYRQAGRATADALHLAMQETSRRPGWASLDRWGPFVIHGDWR